MHGGMFEGISGLYELDAKTLLSSSCNNQNIYRRCQCSLGKLENPEVVQSYPSSNRGQAALTLPSAISLPRERVVPCGHVPFLGQTRANKGTFEGIIGQEKLFVLEC